MLLLYFLSFRLEYDVNTIIIRIVHVILMLGVETKITGFFDARYLVFD
jgi:hypothetical protein